MQFKVNKINADELKTDPVDLKKLSDVVVKNVVKNSLWSVSYRSQYY